MARSPEDSETARVPAGSEESGEPLLDSELTEAVDFAIEPVRLTLAYRAGLSAVAFVMVLLPLIYVAFILLVAYGVWYHATHHAGMMEGAGIRFRVVGYLAPIVAGSLGVAFMVKPLFAPAPARPEPRQLSRTEQPALFAFIETLCTSLGAPTPVRIDVDMQVNASASFRRGLVSFFGSDLVLTLGLPLTAGMSLGQWTGILAHEFGHFTQGVAMRLSYVIGSVNHWFGRVVHERDIWDIRLDRWAEESGAAGAQTVLLTAKLFIWISRRILWLLMVAGLAVSSFLSRQMEYNADLHQARVSGSRLFRTTHLRLPLLATAWKGVTLYLSEMWKERRLVDDVVRVHVAEAERLAESTKTVDQIERDVLRERTRAFDTHPAPGDRIRAVENLAIPARLDDDRPATSVFCGFDALSNELTVRFYEQALGQPIEKERLLPAGPVIAELRGRIAGFVALKRYFLGTELVTIGVAPPRASLSVGNGTDVSAEVTRSRQRMAASVPEVTATLDRLDELRGRIDAMTLASCADAAGLKVKPAAFGLTREEYATSGRLLAEAQAERARLLDSLKPHADDAARRLQLMLRMVDDPGLRSEPGPTVAVPDRIQDLVSTIARLVPLWPGFGRIRRHLLALGFLVDSGGADASAGPLRDQMADLLTSLRDEALAARDALVDVPYPYEHAHGPLDLARFLFDDLPEDIGPDLAQAASNGAALSFEVYVRAWADLAALALEAEECAGLPHLDPPETANHSG